MRASSKLAHQSRKKQKPCNNRGIFHRTKRRTSLRHKMFTNHSNLKQIKARFRRVTLHNNSRMGTMTMQTQSSTLVVLTSRLKTRKTSRLLGDWSAPKAATWNGLLRSVAKMHPRAWWTTSSNCDWGAKAAASKKVPAKRNQKNLFICVYRPASTTSTRLHVTWRKSFCSTCMKSTKSTVRSWSETWERSLLPMLTLLSSTACCKSRRLKLWLGAGRKSNH